MQRRTFLHQSLAALASPSFLASQQGRSASDDKEADVVVIGAGLAGLYAAMLLEAEGKSVIVLEASNRAGGRLYTLDDVAWKPEAGGAQIGDTYKRIVSVAKKHNVALIDEPRNTAPTLICIGGERIKPDAWAQATANKLSANERSILPPTLESTMLRGKSPFKTLDDWRAPAFAHLDVSIAEYLRSQSASAEALRLMDIAADNPSIEQTSVLTTFRSQTYFAQSGVTKTFMVEGGSSRLPEAMAQSLKRGSVRYGAVVRSIEQRSTDWLVASEDGRSFAARSIICSIPLPALKNVIFSHSLAPSERKQISALQAEAIRTVQYTPITQLYAAVKEAFWEKDGLPASMWTDTPLERVFISPAADGKPARMLCWVNGAGARRLDAMNHNEISSLFYATMKTLRPASEGALELVRVNSWGNNRFAGGAYTKFAPGQITKFSRIIAEPLKLTRGGLFFAGEHCAQQASGMEGAMESAERAVALLLG
jgi:monoamine oxidase